MDYAYVIGWGIVVIYIIANMVLVPIQMKYLKAKKEEREREADVNKRIEKQSFEEAQLEYHQLTGIFLPSLLIAQLILRFSKRT